MTGKIYEDWTKTIKVGDIVLHIDGLYSYPVIFQSWNGDSSSYGYRSQHIGIPNYNIKHHWIAHDDNPEEKVKEYWDDCFISLNNKAHESPHLRITATNARAESRFFPFPIKFLTKNQKKFVKIINQLKGYEYKNN